MRSALFWVSPSGRRAGEETESQGHSEHCGSAPCKVWGKTQHQGGKSPTERAICHRTGPDCLLLALTARDGSIPTCCPHRCAKAIPST
uniref:Uncharacterized protein n=1 Tax=Catharus ustulatus TaxID=91951 RepID=A0A8C3V7W7_CATUS